MSDEIQTIEVQKLIKAMANAIANLEDRIIALEIEVSELNGKRISGTES